MVHMSVSSFQQRFKAVTSMSPLQYQKVLRLQEARRLMVFRAWMRAKRVSAWANVSPSQCRTEYGRFFGNAPSKDVARLRGEGFALSDGDR